MAMQGFDDVAAKYGISPRLAQFLLEQALYSTPPDVLETLKGMEPDEFDLLDKINTKFQQAAATGYIVYPFGVH
jgi:hypothetical protein